MFRFLFFNYLLKFLNFCSYCTNFDPIAELVIPVWIPGQKAKAEVEIDPAIVQVII